MSSELSNVGTHLMFENDRVRVWDLALAPGEWLEKHLHRDDFFFIVLQGGDLQHVDPDNAANNRAVSYAADQVVFRAVGAGEAILHHRLVNVGDAPYRNLVIELKSAAPATPSS